jgi:hypothetical protein
VPTKSQARPPTGPAVRDDGGRTRPAHDDLEVEALVSTTSVREQTPRLTVEQRAIAALCHDILSIAEVSAQLHLPLGVIRVLVGDMADEHLVIIYRPVHPGDRPDLDLLERVLYGLTPGGVPRPRTGTTTARSAARRSPPGPRAAASS